MFVRKLPKVKRIKELFTYQQDTGLLIRNKTTAPNALKGQSAGYKNNLGYKLVWVDGQQYLSHRIIWKMVYGRLANQMQIDHIDGVPDNNRLNNLRCVTAKLNRRNQKLLVTNTSGYVGVQNDKRNNKWLASMTINKKHIHIGSFEKIEEAIEARKNAQIAYGFHPNHGRKLIKIK